MEWKKLTIEDKNLFDSFFKTKKYELSNYNFNNFFIWSFGYDIKHALYNDHLIIKLKNHHGEEIIHEPIGNGDSVKIAENILSENNFTILSSYNFAEEIKKHNDNSFHIIEERDLFDYVYDIQELIELKGKKFHNKKNFVNKFRNTYNYEYSTLTENMIDDIKSFQNEWFMKNGGGESGSLKAEKDGIMALLDNFNTLNYKGGIIKIDNKIVAYSIGEPINDEMVVIHIEKANHEFTGAYQIINNEFLKNEWYDYKYVNREEDLGIQGLRQAKLSYNPVKFVEKYKINKK